MSLVSIPRTRRDLRIRSQISHSRLSGGTGCCPGGGTDMSETPTRRALGPSPDEWLRVPALLRQRRSRISSSICVVSKKPPPAVNESLRRPSRTCSRTGNGDPNHLTNRRHSFSSRWHRLQVGPQVRHSIAVDGIPDFEEGIVDRQEPAEVVFAHTQDAFIVGINPE